MTTTPTAARVSGTIKALMDALSSALEWIDAVPPDTPLPTMPGFDRDAVDNLLSAIQPDPEPQPVAESTVRYRLEWLAGARPPAHPEPMKGSATFDTQEDALAFFSRLADDAKPLSLTRTETITTRIDLPSALRALAGEGEQ